MMMTRSFCLCRCSSRDSQMLGRARLLVCVLSDISREKPEELCVMRLLQNDVLYRKYENPCDVQILNILSIV